MRVEATKVLVSTAEFLVKATKFGSDDQKFGNDNQKFGSTNQKFRSANQNCGCLNPRHFLIGLTKIEGQTDQNFTLIQPNRYLVVPIPTKGWKRLHNFYECIFQTAFLRSSNSSAELFFKLYEFS